MTIFIKYDDNGRVFYRNYCPYDAVDGTGMTEAEMQAAGALVDSIPEPEPKADQVTELYYDPQQNVFSYKYFENTSQAYLLKKWNEQAKTADQKYKALDLTTAALTDVKVAKIAQLKEACSQAIYDGFTSSIGHTFGFNELDQANFTQQSVIIVLDGLLDTDTLQWKTVDAGVVTITIAQFKTVVGEAKDYKLQQQGKYWQLEAQVNAAATNAEVDAVVW